MASSIGYGASPMGVAAYAYGLPATAPIPGGAINRDTNGKQQGSVAISLENATKGQYTFDEFGRRRGTSNVRHMVILAMTMVRGSSCVKDLGNRFFETRKIYDSFVEEQKARVTEALASIVDRGLITIDNIIVDPGQGRPAQTRVMLTDLTANVPIDLIL